MDKKYLHFLSFSFSLRENFLLSTIFRQIHFFMLFFILPTSLSSSSLHHRHRLSFYLRYVSKLQVNHTVTLSQFYSQIPFLLLFSLKLATKGAFVLFRFFFANIVSSKLASYRILPSFPVPFFCFIVQFLKFYFPIVNICLKFIIWSVGCLVKNC